MRAGQRVIQVQDPWFTEICAFRKTVEGKIGPYGEFEIGQELTICLPDGSKFVRVRIKGITRYSTLEGYLEGEGFRRTAPQTSSIASAIAAYRAIRRTDNNELVFTDERIAAEGINALEIKLIW
jgi:ASC-1-like (ASCH) protein